ncbi:MAG: hypothetical protein C0497_10320 [Gemmatimonas sp.]|nr:hypothetical protein [Gemmatimonas sp.]
MRGPPRAFRRFKEERDMMSFDDLVALDGELRNTPTLTLYLDGRSENPAWRTAWRRSLKQEETRLRRALADAPHAEREAFTRDIEALEEYLAHRRGTMDAPGWLGVMADAEVRLDVPLRGVTPTIGRWGHGVALAPFLCASEAGDGSAWVVVADSRAARVFRCDDDSVRRVDTVRTQTHPALEEGAAKGRRGSPHLGTRGGVGRAAAERARREARSRMLRTLAAHVRALTPALPVFVGGTPQLLAEAMAAMAHEGVTQVIETPVLGARARVGEIARAVHEGLVQLRRAAEQQLVEELLRRYGDDALGAAGAAITGRALDERSVHTLVLSNSFVALQPEVAEVFVRSALAQDARVEVVSGDAARLLEESGGAGVLLRFSPFKSEPAHEGELATV